MLPKGPDRVDIDRHCGFACPLAVARRYLDDPSKVRFWFGIHAHRDERWVVTSQGLVAMHAVTESWNPSTAAFAVDGRIGSSRFGAYITARSIAYAVKGTRPVDGTEIWTHAEVHGPDSSRTLTLILTAVIKRGLDHMAWELGARSDR